MPTKVRADFVERVEHNELQLADVRAMLEVSDEALKNAYIEIDGLQARLKTTMDATAPTTLAPFQRGIGGRQGCARRRPRWPSP